MIGRIARLTLLPVVCAARLAAAQSLPSEPIALANGRVTVSGDLSAGFGTDDAGFFNYTDYEHSALRLLRIDVMAALTTASVWTPLFTDDTHGRQFAGRVELRPTAGMILGTSFSHGPFVGDAATRAAVGDGHGDSFTQTAWGTDAEYSRDHYLVRL